MKMYLKFGIVAILLAVVTVVIVAKTQRKTSLLEPTFVATGATTNTSTTVPAVPRIVDLGAHTCIPCKRMAPILEELRNEYVGRLQVDFIDVWQDREAGEKHKIRLIPTQIFYDASGKELARHEGFMSKEDILAQWTTLGVTLAAPPLRQE